MKATKQNARKARELFDRDTIDASEWRFVRDFLDAAIYALPSEPVKPRRRRLKVTKS